MKIGLDIDGFVIDVYDLFFKELNQRKGTNFKYTDFDSYWISEPCGITRNELVDIFASLDDRKVELCDPNCPAVIDNLIKEGWTVDLISAHIPHKTEGFLPLYERLTELGIHYNRLIFVDNNDHNAKAKMCADYDYMVDDGPHHIKAMSTKTKAIVYDAPYNINVELPTAYARVSTWSRLEELLLHDSYRENT